MVTGVLLAAGESTRFGGLVPKQLVNIAGKPVLGYSLQTFNDHPKINEIVVVTQENLIPAVQDLVKDSFSKVSAVIKGGKTRYLSSLAAINHVNAEHDTKILFHDAARPFVTQSMISDCLNALEKYDAVTTAIPPSDTLLKVVDNEILSVPNRKDLMCAQTPQGFRLGVVRQAYELLEKEKNYEPTDDCGVVHRFLPEIKIGIVQGSDTNIKLTFPKDLDLAESILNHETNQ